MSIRSIPATWKSVKPKRGAPVLTSFISDFCWTLIQDEQISFWPGYFIDLWVNKNRRRQQKDENMFLIWLLTSKKITFFKKTTSEKFSMKINLKQDMSIRCINSSIFGLDINLLMQKLRIISSTYSSFEALRFLAHLKLLSLSIWNFQTFKAISRDLLTLKPFSAKLIAGSKSFFHGNLPYFFHASCIPFSSAGTPTPRPPGKKTGYFIQEIKA